MSSELTVYCYPRCTTCRRALRWLDDAGVSYETIHIVEQPPTADMLAEWIEKSDYPLKRWFNTSGKKYRELNLKERVDDMSVSEAAQLLASDGMLIRRPLLIDESSGRIVLGFNVDEYQQLL